MVIAVAEDDVSGFIVDTIEEAVQAVQKIASPNRATVRAQFERRFTVERMAHDYLEIYRRAAVSRWTRAIRWAHRVGYFENDWSLNGDVIIGDVLGTLMTMKPTLALVWQLLHAEVTFSKALTNFVLLFASMASPIS